jgi:hypothetical protein
MVNGLVSKMGLSVISIDSSGCGSDSYDALESSSDPGDS